jgi:phosphatidylglycerophosphate synthase
MTPLPSKPDTTAVRERDRLSTPGRQHVRRPVRAEVGVELTLCGPVAMLVFLYYGPVAELRFLAGLLLALALQHGFVWAMARRIGPEPFPLANFVTLSRATTAALLAGFVVSGIHDRLGVAGIAAFALALVAVTLSDWLDGPLARRAGPTKLGAVLDIESDSWLTLWCSAAAVAWGGLPWWVLIPPLLRYIHPIRALLAGGLPSGGGPWWSRVTGVAQMVLFFAVLLPAALPPLDAALAIAALPISAAQSVVLVVLLFLPVSASKRL